MIFQRRPIRVRNFTCHRRRACYMIGTRLFVEEIEIINGSISISFMRIELGPRDTQDRFLKSTQDRFLKSTQDRFLKSCKPMISCLSRPSLEGDGENIEKQTS